MTVLTCDIAIIGGSLGGVAAALAASASGCSVVLTEATDWLGGQVTSQGVSALDEHAYIETFGGTQSYYSLRSSIRSAYAERYGIDAQNPGNGWVSRLCFEPRVGLKVIEAMVAPYLESGHLRVLLNCDPVRARVDHHTVFSVTLRDSDGRESEIRASYFLDATDQGELLPLTSTAYVTGAESSADTGEPGALEEAAPDEIQSFTFGFAVEFVPDSDNTIPKPVGYEHFREAQPYSLTLQTHDGSDVSYSMFEGELSFWTYRRLYDAGQYGQGRDIALINWASNDYYGAALIDQEPKEQADAIDEAKRLSLGFLHWLQTECPRDDGGIGYPELRLRPDVMGTQDGLSKAPYIRESRRIRALLRVVEQDIVAEGYSEVRARAYHTSCGIGWYPIDVHACVGRPDVSIYSPTRPFQIPLDALVPVETHNLIAACKNIGTTHLTNGAYRLHPVEWAIGESAGYLAAFCLTEGQPPAAVCRKVSVLTRLQRRLISAGVPLAWAVDVPLSHPLFAATQSLLVRGVGVAAPLEVLSYRLTVADAELLPTVGLRPGMSWEEACNAWISDQIL